MQISSEVHETLRSFSSKYAANVNSSVAWLLGVYLEPSAIPTILSCIRGTAQADGNGLDVSQDYHLLSSIAPSGLSVVGFFLYSNQGIGAGSESKALKSFLQQNHKHLKSIFELGHDNTKNNERKLIAATTKKTLQLVDVDQLYFYTTSLSSSPDSAELFQLEGEKGVEVVPGSQLFGRVKDQLFLVRVSLNLDLSVAYPEGKYTQKLIENAMPILDSIKAGNIMVTVKNTVIGATQDKSLVGDLLAPLRTSVNGNKVEWLNSIALVGLSSSANKPATLSHVQANETYRRARVTPQLSVLCYLEPATTVATFLKNVSESLYNQAFQLLKLITAPNISPAPYHFLPPKFPHPVTLLYPIDKTVSHSNEDYLTPIRTSYHKQLLLPLDKPLLRLENKITFDPSSPSLPSLPANPLENDYRLKNVHLQLQQEEGTSTGGAKYLVQGNYLYYHYQQEMNDSGWGCAYRSLQTICSWMVLQGYTNKPVPSIPEIQQILVDVKDKEKKFVGSNNWIGSPEVFLCLDHLYGVSSKILNVSSGSEISQKGAELAQHFKTEGTPIMIGGGVLAYTLLGVDYDPSSGNIKFLVSLKAVMWV